jgi:hypothetical protein
MKLSGVHYVIILAAVATAILHITLWPDIMFTLNGLGYLGLLGAYLLPIPFFQERHKLAWWALVGYTALTIVLWVIMGSKEFVPGTSSAIGYYAKAAEVILLVSLWLDRPIERKQAVA